MVLTIMLEGVADAEDLRSLCSWLDEAPELRGRMQLVAPPTPDTLGPATQWLEIALAPGGPVTVLGGALIAWLRHRTVDVTAVVKRPDGSSIDVKIKRAPDVAAAERLQTTVCDFLRGDGDGDTEAGTAGEIEPR